MYTVFVDVCNCLFKISTNSFYLFKILLLELPQGVQANKCEKEIIVIYKELSQLYDEYLDGGIVSSFNQPIFISNQNKETMIISSLEDIYSVRAFITREILDYFYKTKQCIALHSSAIEIGGEGTLFSGEKNSGKSSMCLGAMFFLNAKLISDDITLAFVENNAIYVDGIFKGINADSNTSTILKTGILGPKQEKSIKDRYIPYESFSQKKTKIERVCFSTVSYKTNNVEVKKMRFNSLQEKIQNNLIKSFFGKKFNIDPYLLLDTINVLYTSASVYNVKLKGNLVESINELNLKIGINNLKNGGAEHAEDSSY